MPSPFPGMDPYLEHPDIFPDFHDRFVTYASDAIQPRLPEPYYAALGRRAWIEVSERSVGPDVDVVRPGAANAVSVGTVAVADRPTTEPLVIHVPHDERVEPLVDIYRGRGSERRLVTTIEVLSPSNKTPGEHGRDLYLRKQQEMLHSKVHLVEIDLLRGGRHTTAVPRDRLEAKSGRFDYHVCIHQFDNLEDYFVYPIQLAQPLPQICIPLLPGDGEVGLDLQDLFQRTYDAGECIHTAVPGTHLTLFGNGPLRHHVESTVCDRGLCDCVHFVGYREDARDLIGGADLFVMSSHIEGIPGVVLEAAARRVPSVCTNVGAIDEFIENDRNGLLVAPGDMQALGEAAIRLLRDGRQRRQFGSAALAEVREHYSMERTVDQFESFYERANAKDRAASDEPTFQVSGGDSDR